MEVINPELEEIDGIFYRINIGDDYNAIKDAQTTPYIEFGEEDEVECGREIVDEDISDIEIKYLSDGRFQSSFHVPKLFHPYLIGARGGTKQRLESETRTFIHIPKQGETGDVGRRREDVLCAYRRIKILVATCRSKQPRTHFISLPFTGSELMNNFQRFKQEVLNNCRDCRGISENLFQTPELLHLTFGVMTLADDEERDKAINTFMLSKQFVVDKIFGRQSIRVHVRGLDCMNDDYSNARILFARIEDNPSRKLLQILADSMVDFFVNHNVMEKEREHVKLHVTLMNVQFTETELNQNRKKSTFDATKIFELYKDYDFGEIEINSIHLSQMHTRAENGYYVSSCKMTFY